MDGEYIEAARLAGASTELHERIGAPPWASVTAIQERALTEARLVLGAEAFAALLAEGRRARTGEGTGRFRRVAAQLAANAASPR